MRASGGGLQGAELERAVSAVFDNYGRYWHELFRLQDQTAETIEAHFECEGFEHVEAAHRAGRGTIIALPHLGNYDYAGAWLATRGYPPVVVAEPVEPPDLFNWFAETRRRLGMDVVALGPEAAGAVMRALRANRVVCLVCDRDLAGDGVAVEFFGECTTLPAGPGGARPADRGGAPARRHLSAAARRAPRAHPRSARHDPHRLLPRRPRACHAPTSRADFEELIAAAPEQWLLMQPNWPSDHVANGSTR